ncbi:MAG: restriction endonuclease subunit S [Peptococcaceae bacterium]|nr:restriction endonuclease subunit S [Peptococcaceae bacterium]MBQ3510257.1 restriction endonuclease subunit S [Peptococcaceae bacterium]MBQ6887056.1 restriction endonuclease subunit S [Lachnospiraceae bacterium]
MKSNYDTLGKYIQLVDMRNKDLAITNLLGVSIEKKFILSIANIVGTDLSSYKVVRTGQFAYGPVTSRNGEKISIAYLEGGDCIISSSYSVFEVVNKNELDPEYLMLWFSRPEFDRYARYKSHGSVREIFDWNELCMVELPIPPIDEQKKIVKVYKAITDRIALKKQINDNLEATALTIYKSYFVDFEPFDLAQLESWQEVTIDDIAKEVVCGKTPPTADADNYGGNVPFITIPDMHGSVYTTSTERFLSDKGVATQANKTLPENSICVSCIASVGLVCLTAEPSQTNQQINSIVCKKNISPFYVYIKMTTLTEYLKQLGAGGSTTLNVNKTLFVQIPILLPDETVMNEFHGKVEPLFSAIRANQYEMQHLESLKSLLLTQISSR